TTGSSTSASPKERRCPDRETSSPAPSPRPSRTSSSPTPDTRPGPPAPVTPTTARRPTAAVRPPPARPQVRAPTTPSRPSAPPAEMGSYAIIPAAPVLLDDVDLIETRQTAELRATIRATLRTRPSWALPVESLPPVAGLGGWGIDRGIDTVSGRMLTGSHWVEAVESLTDADRAAAEAVDPAVIVALLHAHSAD